MADDDNNETTPPYQGTPRPLSGPDMVRHRRRFVRGVPVVRPEPSPNVTAPLELLLNGQLSSDDYAQVEALRKASGDVYELLLNLAKAMAGRRDEDRDKSDELERQVIAAVADAAAKLTALEGHARDVDRRVSSIETTIGSVKGLGWKAALAIVATLAGSTTAIVATMKTEAAQKGAASERDANQQKSIDRLERLEDERGPRPRDYDYDLIPRRSPSTPHPRKDPEP